MKSRVITAWLAVALGAAALSGHDTAHAWGSKKKPDPAQEEAQKQQLNPDVATALRAAQELLQKEQWDAAYEKVREAQAVENKSPFDEFQIAQLLGYTELKRQRYAEASAAFEQSIASGMLPPKDAADLTKLIAQIAMQLKDYPKAVQYSGKAIESATTPDAELYALRGQAQYLAEDFKGATETMAQAVEVARKAGKPVDETWLQIELSGYVKLKDEPGVLRSLQQLAIAFPEEKYLQDLFNEWNRQQKDDDRSLLNLYRLMLQQGLLPDGESYLRLAQLAVDAGMPGEAVTVLGQAAANKTFADEMKTERARRQLSTAKAAAATDRKALQALEQATAEKSGEDEVQLGLALISFGEHARGAEALQRGIAKGGVKRLDQAQILLGQSLVKLNKPAEARAAFESLDAASSLKTIAQLWAAYTTPPAAQPATQPAPEAPAPG